MAWLKVDGRLLESEVGWIGPLAVVVYLRALTYCMDFNLDAVPKVVFEKRGIPGATTGQLNVALAGLVEAGVFTETSDGKGFLIRHVWVEDQVYVEPRGAEFSTEVLALARANHAAACAHCGATESLEVDHIVPRARGGETRPPNLQILCRSCNSKKRDRVPWGQLGRSGHAG